MSTEKKTTPADRAKRKPSSRATTTKRTPPKNTSAASKLFCTNCGQELSNGEKFCPSCGTKAPQLRKAKPASNGQLDQDEIQTPVMEQPEVPKPSTEQSEESATVPEQAEAPAEVPNVSDAPVLDVPPVKPEPPHTDSAQVGEWPAFVEMWQFIKQLPLKPSREEKRELRCQAKKRMYKAPILTIACPVITFALFLLCLLLASVGGVKFFFIPMIASLLATTYLIVTFLCIYFTKLDDDDAITAHTELDKLCNIKEKNPKIGRSGRYARNLFGIFALFCIIMIIKFAIQEYSRLFSRLSRHSRMPTAGELKEATALQSQAAEENVSDFDCIMEAEIALKKKDFNKARQWLNRIKDDRLKRLQLATLEQQEKAHYNLQQLEWKLNSGNW